MVAVAKTPGISAGVGRDERRTPVAMGLRYATQAIGLGERRMLSHVIRLGDLGGGGHIQKSESPRYGFLTSLSYPHSQILRCSSVMAPLSSAATRMSGCCSMLLGYVPLVTNCKRA